MLDLGLSFVASVARDPNALAIVDVRLTHAGWYWRFSSVAGLDATDALVDELRMFSPPAQRTAKKLLNDTEDSTLSIAIELEGHCYSRLRQSDDFREGVEAFHEKRAAKFKGS